MLNFPPEILNSKKTITIAVDENDELIFSTDNREGDEWKPWELYGAIQFAAQTFGLPSTRNAPVDDTAPSDEAPEMVQMEMDFPEIPENTTVVKNFEQDPSKVFRLTPTLPRLSMNYSELYPWLK